MDIINSEAYQRIQLLLTISSTRASSADARIIPLAPNAFLAINGTGSLSCIHRLLEASRRTNVGIVKDGVSVSGSVSDTRNVSEAERGSDHHRVSGKRDDDNDDVESDDDHGNMSIGSDPFVNLGRSWTPLPRRAVRLRREDTLEPDAPSGEHTTETGRRDTDTRTVYQPKTALVMMKGPSPTIAPSTSAGAGPTRTRKIAFARSTNRPRYAPSQPQDHRPYTHRHLNRSGSHAYHPHLPHHTHYRLVSDNAARILADPFKNIAIERASSVGRTPAPEVGRLRDSVMVGDVWSVVREHVEFEFEAEGRDERLVGGNKEGRKELIRRYVRDLETMASSAPRFDLSRAEESEWEHRRHTGGNDHDCLGREVEGNQYEDVKMEE